MARSKCYLKLGDPHAALQDAEAALAEDKSFNKVRLIFLDLYLDRMPLAIYAVISMILVLQFGCMLWLSSFPAGHLQSSIDVS